MRGITGTGWGGPRAIPTKCSPEQIEQAKVWRAEGVVWWQVGKRLGVSPDTIRRAVDPEFAAHYRARRKVLDQLNKEGRKKRISPYDRAAHGASVPSQADYLARLAEIPPDTRDLTGVLMGDPLPGRRALDKVAGR